MLTSKDPEISQLSFKEDNPKQAMSFKQLLEEQLVPHYMAKFSVNALELTAQFRMNKLASPLIELV